ALEKLNEMKIRGVNKYTSLQVDSNFHWQTRDLIDTSSQSGYPSIAHYIKKALLVSENDPYNRLYQFLGQQKINRRLHAMGYKGIRITRQFLGLTYDRNRHTNSLRFIQKDGSIIYAQPPAYNTDSFYFGKIIKVGKAHFNTRDSLIHEPFDFTRGNNLPLEDLQQILQSVLFPESVPARQRFNLTKDDYRFVRQYLSQYPSETNYPKYDTSVYYDSYVKDYFNQKRTIPPYMRVFNKVGWAYGFKMDASYVVDFRNKVEYMLTSVLYVNSDEIMNDDKYEYESVGIPFMHQLGETIYQYELTRPREFAPNLRRFKIRYERRDPDDKRPVIKNVDN
ncbi:MAG: serine hydrolase, partial [Saprospiraceae bacterium]